MVDVCSKPDPLPRAPLVPAGTGPGPGDRDPAEAALAPPHNTREMMEFLAARRVAALRAICARELDPEQVGGRALVLEVGCGHGHWLAGYAAAHPGSLCVGIDLKTKRVRLGARKIERGRLGNLHFHKAEAREFLLALPPAVRFDRVAALFLDPWPKMRHHRKRLIRGTFLSLLAEKVRPGGDLLFRTDHPEFFAWTVREVQNHPDWALDPHADWPFELPSLFQEFAPAWQSFIARRRPPPLQQVEQGN